MINIEVLNKSYDYIKQELQKIQSSIFDGKYCFFVEEGTEEIDTIFISIRLRESKKIQDINLGFRFNAINGSFMYIYSSERGKFNGAKYSSIDQIKYLQ